MAGRFHQTSPETGKSGTEDLKEGRQFSTFLWYGPIHCQHLILHMAIQMQARRPMVNHNWFCDLPNSQSCKCLIKVQLENSPSHAAERATQSRFFDTHSRFLRENNRNTKATRLPLRFFSSTSTDVECSRMNLKEKEGVEHNHSW